jgi:hypothetical protein
VQSRLHLSRAQAVAFAVLLVLAVGMGVLAFWVHEETSADVESAVSGPGAAATVSSTDATEASVASASTTTASTAPPFVSSTEEAPISPESFDCQRAMAHIKVLAEDIGVRQAGSEEESTAKDYVTAYLERFGYRAEVSDVVLPDGRVSHNVRATKQGTSSASLVVGAHLDSMAPSPGANDDGSGVAVLLELARDLLQADVTPTVEFVFFGAEEVVDSDPNHHHLGSRQYVAAMTSRQTSELVGMFSIDMIAYGSELVARTMGSGPERLVDMLLSFGAESGTTVNYALDPGETGWSDHEAFERAGYPVAWLERRPDVAHHTVADTYAHCDPLLVQQTGDLLLGFLSGLAASDLDALKESRAAE